MRHDTGFLHFPMAACQCCTPPEHQDKIAAARRAMSETQRAVERMRELGFARARAVGEHSTPSDVTLSDADRAMLAAMAIGDESHD